MLHTDTLSEEIRRVTINGRDFDLDVARNKLLPVVRGGAGAPPPPAAPASPEPPAPAAPAAPAATPDLGALQKELDRAAKAGATAQTNELLKTLGFDKLEDAQAFITAKRDADTAALTEVEKREKAAADREAAALKREADAADLINRGVIRNALQAAGVPAASLDDAEGLVKITGDVTIESAGEAVAALKAKPAFTSLFTEPATATAPSGVTPPGTPAHPNPAGKGIDAGRELAKKHREDADKRGPLNTMHVVGGQRSA